MIAIYNQQKITFKNNSGLTIFELMITMTILAMITSFAVPSYQKTKQTAIIDNVASTIHAAVSNTRLLAMNYQTFVSICPTADIHAEIYQCINWEELTASSSDNAGWIIYQNHNKTETNINKSDVIEITQFQSVAKNKINLAHTGGKSLTFNSRSYTEGLGSSFSIKLDKPSDFYKKIIISTVGRTREETIINKTPTEI